jgi:ZIP family zinc transporter
VLWGFSPVLRCSSATGVGYLARIPQRVIASVRAFGAEVLLSAVAFELIGEAHGRGGLVPAALSATVGAAGRPAA